MINKEKLATYTDIPLAYGAHRTFDKGACAMEMVAWLADEPHSDRPKCTCPVIAEFVRRANDRMNGATRQRVLAPLLPSLVGTRSTLENKLRRAYACADWAVRTVAPIALRATGLVAQADALAALPEIVDQETADAAADAARAARAARAAAAYAADAASDAAAAWYLVPALIARLVAIGGEA